jgi:hypothetical protein
MKAALKVAFARVAPEQTLYLRAYRLLLLNQKSYLHQTGWLRSLADGRPVDRLGGELPWMNYAVVRLLQDRLSSDLDLFEYGSGSSTAYFAKLVRRVTSVEHDQSWVERVRPMLPANAELVFTPVDVDGGYCRAVHATGRRHDVIVVDGRDRVNCLRQSASAVSERGVILLDDSHRESYGDGVAFLHERGFRSLRVEGLKPTGTDVDCTTVFYRDGNCLNL